MRGTGHSTTQEDIYAFNKGCKILVHASNWYNNQSISFDGYNYTIKRAVGSSDKDFYDAFVEARTDAEAEQILYAYNQNLFQHVLLEIAQVNSERRKQGLSVISFDFIHTPTSWFTIDASRMLADYFKTPLVSTIHVNEKELQSIETFKLPHSKVILQKDLETKQYSDLVICKNKIILEDTLLVNSSAIEINNDLSLPPLNTDELSSKNTNNILYVGRLSYEKGFDRFAELVKTLNEKDNKFNFYICGSSLGLDEKVEILVQELKLYKNVFFLGYLPIEELQDIYVKCAYVIIPSRSEAYCRVVLEALYFGCYVFATDVGSASSQIISEKHGKVVENSDESIKNLANHLNIEVDYRAIHQYGCKFNSTYNVDKKMSTITNFLNAKKKEG